MTSLDTLISTLPPDLYWSIWRTASSNAKDAYVDPARAYSATAGARGEPERAEAASPQEALAGALALVRGAKS